MNNFRLYESICEMAQNFRKAIVVRDIVGYWVRDKECSAGMQRNPCVSSSLKGALERLGSRWEDNIKVDDRIYFVSISSG
jgi:hypothetical protein